MTARDYLSQAYRLEERIKMHREEIERLRATALTVSSPGFGEHISGSRKAGAAFERVLLKIMDMQEKEVTMLDTLLTLKDEIKESINGVEDMDERIVLYQRYICNETWVNIGYELGWDEKTIRRIHNRACAHFVIPENPTIIL